MPIMPEQVEHAFGLTLLSPIIHGRDAGGVPHDVAVRRVLAAMHTGAQAPLARVPGVHLARWVLIDDVPSEGFPAQVDRLKSKYLLFSACFDGDLAPFLEGMRTRIGHDVAKLYQHCVNFPGIDDATAFSRWMMRCKIYTSFFFPAYPETTLDQVLRSLDTQRRVADFALAHQGSDDDAALLHGFREFLGTVQRAPTPAPGTI